MISLQIQDTCFHLIFQDNPQPFLVETWSDCSDSKRHHGPLLLEPTFVNSTVVTLLLPHLHPSCHVIATVQYHEVFINLSSNISFCEFCNLCGVPRLDPQYKLVERWIQQFDAVNIGTQTLFTSFFTPSRCFHQRKFYSHFRVVCRIYQARIQPYLRTDSSC